MQPAIKTFLVLATIWLLVVIIGETQVQMPWQPTRFHPEIARTMLAILAGWGAAAIITAVLTRRAD